MEEIEVAFYRKSDGRFLFILEHFQATMNMPSSSFNWSHRELPCYVLFAITIESEDFFDPKDKTRNDEILSTALETLHQIGGECLSSEEIIPVLESDVILATDAR